MRACFPRLATVALCSLSVTLAACSHDVAPVPSEPGGAPGGKADGYFDENGEWVEAPAPEGTPPGGGALEGDALAGDVQPDDAPPAIEGGEFVSVTWSERVFSSTSVAEGSYIRVPGRFFGSSSVTPSDCHVGIFDANREHAILGFRSNESGGTRFFRMPPVQFPVRDRAGRHFLDAGYCAQMGGPVSFYRVWNRGGNDLSVWVGPGTPSGATQDCAEQEWPPQGVPGDWHSLNVRLAAGAEAVTSVRAVGAYLGGRSETSRHTDVECTSAAQSGEAASYFSF